MNTLMRRPYLSALVSVSLIIALAFGSYLYWAYSTYVSREVRRRTGAKRVRVLDEFHSDSEWYAKVEIEQQAGKRLLAKDEWLTGFKKKAALSGRIVSDKLSDCLKCSYRIEQNPHDLMYHPYDYTVYVLSPDAKTLELYEVFGS